MFRVCFVCHGNICRSPTAAGVMEKLVAEARLEHLVAIDSAGTADYHTGERPDRRARVAAEKLGIRLPGVARQFVSEDFEAFDFILVMDVENRRDLSRVRGHELHQSKVHLLRDFDPTAARGSSVPDPYYGGASGFDEVLAQCDRACRGLLEHLRGQQPR